MWDGTMWESGGAEASPYVATPAPASFPVFLYLKFVGSDGVETYTPARRIIMTCAQPCLLLWLLAEELLASQDCLCVVIFCSEFSKRWCVLLIRLSAAVDRVAAACGRGARRAAVLGRGGVGARAHRPGDPSSAASSRDGSNAGARDATHVQY